MLRRLLPVVLVLSCGATTVGTACAQCEPQWQPGDAVVDPLGTVDRVLAWDPDGAGPAPILLVAAGEFTVAHMASTGIAAFDGTQWLPLGTPPPGIVTALGTYNGLLIAAFSQAFSGGGYSIASFDGVAWQSLGSVGSTSSTGKAVVALAVFQGELIAAGLFQSVGGLAVNNIARWNDSTWSSLGVGVSGNVLALAVYANQLYVGGNLTAAGGIPVGNLATWNGSGWAATQPCNGTVNTLAVRSGQTLASSYLFAGGSFWIIGTGGGAVTAHSVARYSSTTNAWTAMGTDLNGVPCKALFVAVAGVTSYDVTAVVGAPQWSPQVRRWNGTSWSSLGNSANLSPGTSLCLFGGQYVVGQAYGTTALLRYDGVYWRPVSGAGFDGSVAAVLEDGAQTILGGDFTILGVPMHGVARGTSNAWSPIGGGVIGSGGSVQALARAANGDVIAGGWFGVASGGAGDNVARWNGSAWLPMGTGTNGAVDVLLALPNGDVIAGGNFTVAGGTSALYVARWNGSSWSPLGGGMNAPVHALALLPNGDVVAGGEFTLAGSLIGVANRVARWDGSSWSPIGAGFDNTVRALAVLPNGDLMAGGDFQNSGPWPTRFVARWGGLGWSAPWISWPRSARWPCCRTATSPSAPIRCCDCMGRPGASWRLTSGPTRWR